MHGLGDMEVYRQPYWLLEAMVCMNYVHVLDSEEWLNKSGSWSRQQKEEFLEPYRSYRDNMRARLQPVLDRYPLLSGYVHTTPRVQESLKSCDPPLISFLIQMQDVLEAGAQGAQCPSDEELEEELSRAFQRILDSDLRKTPEDEEPEIHSLTDVMTALEGWDGEDADKFKLLRLYSERREVMEQLLSLRESCAEIGRDCLASVQERLDAFEEKLRNPGELRKLLSALGLQFGEDCDSKITPLILPYDRIMLCATRPEEAERIDLKIHMGIETFYLYAARQEDLYHDDWLLSRLKALGDPTRLKILHLLVERPCYLQEMARTLGLTPATVLHHLGTLMTEELIEIKMTDDRRRIYYQVRQQGLREVSTGIQRLALSPRELEEQQRQRVLDKQQTWGGRQWTI